MEQTVVFGADYYPEQWPPDQWEHDARLMSRSGITLVRLMEFAWSIIEPTPGVYDFSLFDTVIGLFRKYNIQVILGTPTATVPIWLSEKDNSIFQIHPRYGYRNFGTRRQACLNSPVYLQATDRITNKCAEHFSRHSGIIGWQIDNEIGHEGSDLCVCPHCKRAWHSWLQDRYGSVQELNRVWGTVFWSTIYSEWNQIPQPKPQAMSIQNPGLILDYYRFLSWSAEGFVARQAKVLREKGSSDWEITTDTFIPPNGHIIDLAKLFAPLDSVGVNNYPVWGDQTEPIPMELHTYALQFFRGLKKRDDFTVFEQICGFQGHRVLGYHPPPEQIVHWTNHVIAHGAHRVIYFRWRTARTGQEQLCHGLVNPGQDDTPHFSALRNAWKNNKKIYSRIASGMRNPQALVLWNKDECRVLKDQWLSKGLQYDAGFVDVGYDVEIASSAAPLVLFNVDMDIRPTEAVHQWPLDLDNYKIILLPIKQIGDAELIQRLDTWVQKGGTLVLGYRTGTRTGENHAIEGDLPGSWGPISGVRVRSFESLNEGKRPLKIKGSALGVLLTLLGKLVPGIRPEGSVWTDFLEPWHSGQLDNQNEQNMREKNLPLTIENDPVRTRVSGNGLRVLAEYQGGFWNRGAPGVTEFHRGRGLVYYLGTRLEPTAMVPIFRRILKQAGVQTDFAGRGIEIIHRIDVQGKKFRVILNHTAKKRRTPYGTIPPFGMEIRD